MLLDLAKAVAFFFCILAVCRAALYTFFIPGTHWHERLFYAFIHLALAACICFLSGIVFSLPIPTNPDRNQPLAHTMPVRLYLWSLIGISILFAMSWYLADLAQQSGAFITFRTYEKF
jgi:hypothetical protein